MNWYKTFCSLRFITFSLFMGTALCVAIGLGTWQVYRLHWKGALIHEIKEKMALPAAPLPSSIDDVKLWQYRKVAIQGVFDHDKEIHLYTGPRVFKGAPGYNILTPFHTSKGDTVLVNRGWVPATLKLKEKRLPTLVATPVSMEGLIISGEKKRWFTPENEIDKNMWFWIDMAAVSAVTHMKFNNYYIRALTPHASPDMLPIPGDTTIAIRNDHLQYAVTWYSLAIILVVIYGLFAYKLWKEKIA